MENKKLVSVNITTFNRSKLLSRCLDSVLRQNYQNMEIIIVDDNSVDNTYKIIKKYQKKDKRIRYFKHSYNMGNAFARNTALNNCSGFYVAFMDDDDEWIDNSKIKKQVEIFESTKDDNLAIICSGVRIFRSATEYKDMIIQRPKNLISLMLKGNIIFNSTVMTKKNIMTKLRGFDENLSRGIDSDYCRRCVVGFNHDVYFMKDITTGVHIYGNDRITNIENLDDIYIAFNTFRITVGKFWFKILLNPRALLSRIYQFLILIFQYFSIVFKINLRK